MSNTSIRAPIRIADCPPVPWKNGGGTTREIAVYPPGAGMDDFLWRISMARVDRPGPFSAFPGVDRVLAVLDGTLRLTAPNAPNIEAHVMTGQSPPHAFDGDAAIWGEPLGGPVLDLNVMARRAQCAIAMRRLPAGAMADVRGTTFLTALEPMEIGSVALGRLDSLRLDRPVRLPGAAILTHLT
ncbi:HutD family protein [Sphingobium aquiterrae]|uniref:HutD/Ves family protein n=1 Tax=Sphingobium aquiterrae TaxID=2038656 RepID=UPI0030163E83